MQNQPNEELIIVIEVTVPWNTKLDERLTSKSDKYSAVIEFLTKQGYNAKLICVGIGALGTVTPKAALCQLRLTVNEHNKLLSKILQIVCRFSEGSTR